MPETGLDRLTPEAGSAPEAARERLAAAIQAFNLRTESLQREYERLRREFDRVSLELATRNAELATSLRQTDDVRAHLDGVLQSLSVGVIACDSRGAVTLVNHALSELCGLPARELLGRPCPASLPPPARHGPGPEPCPTERAWEIARAGGERIPVECTVASIAASGGGPDGWVVALRDLRPIRRLEAQLERSRTLAALGELAAGVAHEIRNPLGGIEGFVSLLGRSLEPDDPRHELVRKIRDGVRGVDAIVQNLLMLARPTSLQLRPVDVRALCERSLELALAGGREGGALQVGLRVSPEGLRVLGDPGPLSQVLVNLVRNAVEAMPQGGRLELSAEARGEDQVQLSVADTGVGMGPAERERLFTPFFSTKERGTGLGLAIVHGIVRAHGGRIEVESEAGRGTRVRLQFTRAAGAADAPPLSRAA